MDTANSGALWSVYTDPDVRGKRCSGCNEWMRYEAAAAVLYHHNNCVYHWYCLMTHLAQTIHGTSKVEDSSSNTDTVDLFGGMRP